MTQGKNMTTVHGIEIDLSRDKLFDEHGLARLRDSYMATGEISPQERFAFVSKTFATNDAHAQRLYDYSSKHWLSYATPLLSYGRSKKGLNISCFLSMLDDSAEGLVDTLSEVNWLSMLGGGVGIHVKIRGADDKSVGVLPHLKTYEASSLAYRQGKTRRGSYAAFLDISHPDIVSFMELRKSTGDQRMRAPNLHHGVNISDKFMQIIERCMRDPKADDSWPLINPANGKVVEVVSAKHLWSQLLELRVQLGEPYIVFLDAANRRLPSWLKEQELAIHGSNLCTEIFLPTSKDRTAVCCLSSLNLEYYDEWKNDPLFIGDVLEMLDNSLQSFIDNAPDTISRARFSAYRERSVGLGALGLHSYFQSHDIPFESALAKSINKKIFKHIHEKCAEKDLELCELRGACPDAAAFGVKRRLSHWMAIAPNASSSVIMGNCSPSIEPFSANIFQQITLSGSFVLKNKYLVRKLQELNIDNDQTWSSINAAEGSIQHLDLPQDIKDVFKTALELDQSALIQLAADRGEYVDQGQSLNVFFRPTTTIKYLHAIHFLAWKLGLKSLYYLRSEKLKGNDKIGTALERKKIEEDVDMSAIADGNVCVACEG